MIKKFHLNHLFLVIIAILILTVLILLNLVINSKFNLENLDLNDIMLRTIPPLSGAFFSGIIAYLIFHLTKNKEINTKINESKNALIIIRQEVKDNLDNARSLNTALSLAKPNSIAQMIESEKLSEEKRIINKLEVIESRFSTQLIDNLVSKLSDKDFLLVAKEIKYIKMIIKSLNLLIEKEYGVENKSILIENILNYTSKLEQSYNNNKTHNSIPVSMDLSITKYNLKILVIFVIIIFYLYFVLR